ncbi:hypothetical protein ASPZODRAFT_133659 [Penicilliopsis zonata CBS 506.65]|uniref:Uncharacterized protein n=1 Tax=Penicilliopsis zonata CBS 506.65 TaxID=1073090 RepID=A0A1L9SFB2_9EURO|nr:hypothetical protein ASPZODRAFT_133659 [Penicilliopsis zonata CBS 506.65]OJJ45793.1 hypothetical protein ASPZODRAFT_133659 [Penicilliopsis zonata CBS 506.65]
MTIVVSDVVPYNSSLPGYTLDHHRRRAGWCRCRQSQRTPDRSIPPTRCPPFSPRSYNAPSRAAGSTRWCTPHRTRPCGTGCLEQAARPLKRAGPRSGESGVSIQHQPSPAGPLD